jgi:monooxygenase
VQHADVLIMGAGLSGIGAACRLTMHCPDKTYIVLEARHATGGTWDLFRYPGVRSDSEMFTLGYSFRPWAETKSIASGPAVLNYVRETAAEYGVEKHIRFGHQVKRASWSSDDALWTVEAETEHGIVKFTCNFLFACSGYYDYESGHVPEFSESAAFAGRIVHAQHWPDDLDYAGKRVVVIGSGATAVTLVPAMAERSAHVTMLQRSPSYVVARPAEDRFANWLRRTLPAKPAYWVSRWYNVLFQIYFFGLSRRKPVKVKQEILKQAKEQLGPAYDVERHFTPRYNPWDQRVCLVPDGDLFAALRNGTASVVTDEIERFTKTGILLRSGVELKADIIVLATGLTIKFMGGLEVDIDGVRVDFTKRMSYKAMMFSDVPNLAISIGYTNASWTLKSDLTAEFVCRLLKYMDRHGYAQAMPKRDPNVAEVPFMDFSSGYVQRAIHKLPRQGTKTPWRLHGNYAKDLVALRYGGLNDGTMEFVKRKSVEK